MLAFLFTYCLFWQPEVRLIGSGTDYCSNSRVRGLTYVSFLNTFILFNAYLQLSSIIALHKLDDDYNFWLCVSMLCIYMYRVGQKWYSFLYALTSSNINQFSKLFHCQNQEKTCNNTNTKDPTTPQVCRYTTLWNVKCLKATIENKVTPVTRHF